MRGNLGMTLREAFLRHPAVNYIARDEDGLTWGYKTKPARCAVSWVATDGCAVRILNLTGVKKDWTKSLVARNEILKGAK